jgi:hypothetical protein
LFRTVSLSEGHLGSINEKILDDGDFWLLSALERRQKPKETWQYRALLSVLF